MRSVSIIDNVTVFHEYNDKINANFLDSVSYIIGIVYPNAVLKGYAEPGDAEPSSPADNDAYIVSDSGTIWGISATKDQFIIRISGVWVAMSIPQFNNTRATYADHAGLADTATHALQADNATYSSNSDKLDGLESAQFARADIDQIVCGVYTFNKSIIRACSDNDVVVKSVRNSTDQYTVQHNGADVEISNQQGYIRNKTDITFQKTLGTDSFSSGFSGSGWRIEDDGSKKKLTIDELVVRDRMDVYELVVNQIRGTNGALAVTDTGKILSVTDTGTAYQLFFDTDGGNNPVCFVVGDKVKCQRFTGSNVKEYTGIVSSVGNDNIIINKTDLTGDIPSSGDVVCRWNSTVDGRKGILYLTSSDQNSPYMSVVYDEQEQARIGRLDGITDANFGTLSGYGMYAQNAFLKGKFWLSSTGQEVGDVLSSKVSTIVYNQGISDAKNYTDSQTNTAQSNAISASATDATTKANTAQANAISSANNYTDSVKTNLQTSITQNTNDIALKAAQTDLNSLGITVNSLQSQLTVQAGQISTKVESITYSQGIADTKSYADTSAANTANNAQVAAISTAATNTANAVNGIVVGGRNLLANSALTIFDQSTYDATTTWENPSNNNYAVALDASTQCNGFNSLKFTTSVVGDGTPQKRIPFQLVNAQNFLPNTEYIFSCYLKSSGTPIFSMRAGWGSLDPTNGSHTLSSTWTKYTFRVVSSASASCWILLWYSTTDTVWMCQPKFEIGNKATDWSPAPEDVDSSIATVQSNLSTYITQNNAAVSIKANETDLNTLTGRVTTAESNITANANGITEKVSKDSVIAAINLSIEAATISAAKINLNGAVTFSMFDSNAQATINAKANSTDVTSSINSAQAAAISVAASDATNKVNAVQVGGRNLLRNSNFAQGLSYWTSYGASESNISDSTFNYCEKIVTTNGGQGIYTNPICNAGNTYAWSIWLKADSACNVAINNEHGTGSQVVNVGTTWAKYTGTGLYNGGAFSIYSTTISTFYIANTKYELGNKATDWSPAPEDVQAYTDTAQSNAQSYAASQATAAQNSAISTAASDAATKANNALSSAQSYAASQASAAQTAAINAAAGDVTNRGLTTAGIFKGVTNIGGFVTVGAFVIPSNTPDGILINTNIAYGSSKTMYNLKIDGYMYGNASTLKLNIVWYPYNNDIISYSFTNSGTFVPGTITLGTTSAGMMFVQINSNVYFPNLAISIAAAMGSGLTDSDIKGWTVVDGGIPSGATRTHTVSEFSTKAETTAISTASSDASTKASNAQSAAISAAASDATSKVSTLQGQLGSLAYKSAVSAAMMDSTFISGGYILTTLLDVKTIVAQGITTTGLLASVAYVDNLGVRVLRTADSGARVVCGDAGEFSAYNVSGTEVFAVRYGEDPGYGNNVNGVDINGKNHTGGFSSTDGALIVTNTGENASGMLVTAAVVGKCTAPSYGFGYGGYFNGIRNDGIYVNPTYYRFGNSTSGNIPAGYDCIVFDNQYDGTYYLPALSSVPDGYELKLAHLIDLGTMYIDPSSGDTIDKFTSSQHYITLSGRGKCATVKKCTWYDSGVGTVTTWVLLGNNGAF